MGIIDDLLAVPARIVALHDDVRRLTQQLYDTEARMTAAESAAFDNLNTTINTVKDGWAALIAERDTLRAALANTDAATQQAVADALEQDATVDAGKVQAANDALAELVAPQVNPEGG